MSVVIMVRSGKELFLFGDKKSTHINNFDREKETYEEQSVSYDSRKVYQVKDDIIIGMVGSSLGYDNLFRYVINNQQVEKDVADMMENYQDFVHNWLDYQYDDIKKYFDNINIDLIYAAYDDINILKSDIDCFLELDIPHISTYSLIIEDNTVLKINGTKNIDEDLDYEMYNYIQDTLEKNGYIHYEISNYYESSFRYRSQHYC